MNIQTTLKKYFPISVWLPAYKKSFIRWDLVAGITLASFVLPESMAYATLAGVPYLFWLSIVVWQVDFSLPCSLESGQVAVGPTSSHFTHGWFNSCRAFRRRSFQVGRDRRINGIGSCRHLSIAYILKLSSVVNFISDSILLGFKAGAALSIMAYPIAKIIWRGGWRQ